MNTNFTSAQGLSSNLLDTIPKYCELCGRTLYLTLGPQGFPWMQCPKWPNRGEHWWSLSTEREHSRIGISDAQADTLERANPIYDTLTGKKL